MLLEVFDPIQACIVIGPPVRGRFNRPGVGKTALGVPVGEVAPALNQQKRGDVKAVTTNTGNRGRPFSITRLNCLAHHEAGLVEVVQIAVLDTVFGPHVRE